MGVLQAAGLLGAALLAISGLVVGLAAATAARKLVRQAGERRRATIEATVRPLLIRIMAEEAVDPAAFPSDRASRRTLEGLAREFMPTVGGPSRAALVELLERRGAVTRARARTHRAGAVGRARAAEFLGWSGSAGALDDLVRLLGDQHPDVRPVAARALGRLGDPAAAAPLLGALDGRRALPTGVVSMALLRLGPAAVPALRAGLAAGSAAVRSTSAELLGLLGADEAVDDLLAALGRDDFELRVKAARALGRISSPRAALALAGHLAPGTPDPLRAVVAMALGRIGAPEAVPALRAAVADEHHRIAHNAAASLAQLGERGRDALRQLAEAGAAEGADAAAASAGGHAAEALARAALADRTLPGQQRGVTLAGGA